MNAAVNRTVVLSAAQTEIHFVGHLAITGHVNRMFNQFVHAFVFYCRNRNNRHAEHLLQPVNVDGRPVHLDFIHHIQRHHHRNMQIQKLQSQKQVSFNI